MFDIDFFGTIGANGCYSFGSFKRSQVKNDIIIETWGKYDKKAVVCPTVMVYLTGHKETLSIPDPGIYNIKIRQPDNTYLVKQINIY
jgi:hypothetical protein